MQSGTAPESSPMVTLTRVIFLAPASAALDSAISSRFWVTASSCMRSTGWC